MKYLFKKSIVPLFGFFAFFFFSAGELQARQYDPGQGRFISRDPIGMVDGPNLYAGHFAMYFANDPKGKNTWTIKSRSIIFKDTVTWNKESGKTRVKEVSQDKWAKQYGSVTGKSGGVIGERSWGGSSAYTIAQLDVTYECKCKDEKGADGKDVWYFVKDSSKIEVGSDIWINRTAWNAGDADFRKWVIHAEYDHVNDLLAWANGSATTSNTLIKKKDGFDTMKKIEDALSKETWDTYDKCVLYSNRKIIDDLFYGSFGTMLGQGGKYWDQSNRHNYDKKDKRRAGPTGDEMKKYKGLESAWKGDVKEGSMDGPK